jgi:ABC-type amino acid transport system, permease component
MLYEITVGLKYIPIVILLSVVPLIIGLILGTIIAVIRLFKVPVLNELFAALVIFIRGVPLILQLTALFLFVNMTFDSFAAFWGLSFTSKDISYTVIALIGITINATAYLSEVVRTALQSVDNGQYEAGYSVGLTALQTLGRIVIPQAVPVAIPLLGSSFIGLIKGSSAASLVSVVEVINATLHEANRSYSFLEAYVASAVIYWAMCIIVERIVAFLEAHVGAYYRGGVL